MVGSFDQHGDPGGGKEAGKAAGEAPDRVLGTGERGGEPKSKHALLFVVRPKFARTGAGASADAQGAGLESLAKIAGAGGGDLGQDGGVGGARGEDVAEDGRGGVRGRRRTCIQTLITFPSRIGRYHCRMIPDIWRDLLTDPCGGFVRCCVGPGCPA